MEGATISRPGRGEAVFVCVRSDWCILALKNAQCFLRLGLRLDGLAGRNETIDRNTNGKMGNAMRE